MSTEKLIYKILTREQWQTMQQSGTLVGAPIDLQDGYIHFSTATQTSETLAKYFGAQSGLELLEVSVDKVSANLKWETSRNDQLFPHLYAKLQLDEVNRHWTLDLDSDGVHILPPFGVTL